MPTPTPYPSRVTRRFQPPVPTLARTGGCICLAPPLAHIKVSSSSISSPPSLTYPHQLLSRDGPRPLRLEPRAASSPPPRARPLEAAVSRRPLPTPSPAPH